MHIIEAQAEGSEPGTLNSEKDSEAGPFPTIAVNGAYRISKRWAVTARGQTFTANADRFEGTLSDYHADIQYRWRKNFAVGIGYSSIAVDLDVHGCRPAVPVPDGHQRSGAVLPRRLLMPAAA